MHVVLPPYNNVRRGWLYTNELRSHCLRDDSPSLQISLLLLSDVIYVLLVCRRAGRVNAFFTIILKCYSKLRRDNLTLLLSRHSNIQSKGHECFMYILGLSGKNEGKVNGCLMIVLK